MAVDRVEAAMVGWAVVLAMEVQKVEASAAQATLADAWVAAVGTAPPPPLVLRQQGC